MAADWPATTAHKMIYLLTSSQQTEKCFIDVFITLAKTS